MEIFMTDFSELMKAAKDAKSYAYSPYSGYSVGAALLCANGKIFTGVNIENASFPAGICAERSAFSAAISAGEREFSALAISGSSAECFPCGICRQVISEFCAPDFPIILEKADGKLAIFTLSELLPYSFSLSRIDNK